MKEQIREILSWYAGENPGVRTNLTRILNHGRLGGSGKVIMLPVDQGFEQGPTRSFAPNPEAYNPHYHFQLAIDSGCNAYAAPLGFLQAGVSDYCGDIPLILKCNSHDSLFSEIDRMSAPISTVQDALRLGCAAVGFTIYPGSAKSMIMYEQLGQLVQQARQAGLVTVVWSYAIGSGLSQEGWTAVDVVAYATHIAAQIGAHIIKVVLPNARVEQTAAQQVYQEHHVPIQSLTDRVRHIVQAAFDGRRIVIFAGGPFVNDEQLLTEILAIHEGGGSGSIIGRNLFQRPKKDALDLIDKIASIYMSSEKER